MVSAHHRFKKMPKAFIRAFGSPTVFYLDTGTVTMTAIAREQSEDLLLELGGSGIRKEGAFLAIATDVGGELLEETRFLYEGAYYKISSPPEHDGRGMTQYSIIRDGVQI